MLLRKHVGGKRHVTVFVVSADTCFCREITVRIGNDCFVDVYEDSYEEGGLGFEKNYNISFNGTYTLDELMKKLSDYGFSDNPKDYVWWDENNYSELMTDALLCEDDTEPSKKEMEMWQNGELKLYTHRLSMNIQLIDVRDLTDKDAKEFGFSLY